MKKKGMVFGSFVVDLTGKTPHLPVPGETVLGSYFKMGPGGKGFNQGVAAHKAGADITMVTKLGRDTLANIALDTMDGLGMDKEQILFHESAQTGVALILVDENTAQNEIIVISGACGTITEEEVMALEPLLDDVEYALLQLEVNEDANETFIRMAEEKGVKVILNTAPAAPVSDEILGKVWMVTPNEVEAEILSGIPVTDEVQAEKAAQYFRDKGVKNVIITMGSRGVYVTSEEAKEWIPAYKVDAIDTTGAGDAFNGGVLAALLEGKSLPEACRFANALAALSVQRFGTTPSMPTREEIDRFIEAAKKGD